MVEIPTTSCLIFMVSDNKAGYYLIGNNLKLLWNFIMKNCGSECFLFQSYEAGRELGGGSLSRPKATTGVRAGRESVLRETRRLEMQRPGWGKANRAAWVGKNRQISRKMRRNCSQKVLVFTLLQRNVENLFFTARSKVFWSQWDFSGLWIRPFKRIRQLIQ